MAEIVNEPTSFVYTFDTHGKKQVKKKPSGTVKNVFVVDKTEWIIWCAPLRSAFASPCANSPVIVADSSWSTATS